MLGIFHAEIAMVVAALFVGGRLGQTVFHHAALFR